MRHITVLKTEAVDGLALDTKAVVVDATYGGGGHSLEILSRLGTEGRLISIDADPHAFTECPIVDERQVGIVGNFRDITSVLTAQGLTSVDAILADLGWRTDQFESGGKGFSFSSDEPLLMTFGDPATHVFTAHDVVNTWEEENLADIIYAYGEEPFARVIAKAIVEKREEGKIATAKALADCIVASLPPRALRSRINPATKTFQAIRIAVNDELGALRQFISVGYELLAPNGRFAIISFHSLEDRIVKNAFRTFAHDHDALRITKKPIIPTNEEIKTNPRARSAKLRIIQKPA